MHRCLLGEGVTGRSLVMDRPAGEREEVEMIRRLNRHYLQTAEDHAGGKYPKVK